jgi:hypothetical protein
MLSACHRVDNLQGNRESGDPRMKSWPRIEGRLAAYVEANWLREDDVKRSPRTSASISPSLPSATE